MTAQEEPSTRHASGTRDVAHTIMPQMIAAEMSRENQKLVNNNFVQIPKPWGDNDTPFHYLWDLLEEIGAFDFFLCGTPCHIVREQVRENSLSQGNAEPTKEEEARSQTQRGFPSAADGRRRLTRMVSRRRLLKTMSTRRCSFSTIAT